MLQAWLPAAGALLGGVITVLRIGLFSYWINTYSGGGSVAALGGALLLGGLPRFIRPNRMRDSLLIAVGLCVLALSRPYEGLLLCLPAGFVLMRWIFSRPRRPTARLILRSAALPARAHCCGSCVARLLRLTRIRKPGHAALRGIAFGIYYCLDSF
jgi:hypothetical protein